MLKKLLCVHGRCSSCVTLSLLISVAISIVTDASNHNVRKRIRKMHQPGGLCIYTEDSIFLPQDTAGCGIYYQLIRVRSDGAIMDSRPTTSALQTSTVSSAMESLVTAEVGTVQWSDSHFIVTVHHPTIPTILSS